MTKKDSAREVALTLARGKGVISAREVTQAGVHSQQLTRLVAERVLERVSRGQYRLADRPVTEHHGLVMAAQVVPEGVICLLSALSFHGIGSQLPPEVWVALPRGARTPRPADLPLRFVRADQASFTEGIERHQLEGVRVKVYGVAKTIADLFKHRNRIGIDVAIEALGEAWRERRFAMAELEAATRVCRVSRVIRPYLEAVVT